VLDPDPDAATPRVKKAAPLPLRFRYDGAFKILQVCPIPHSCRSSLVADLAPCALLLGGGHALRQRRRHALPGRGRGRRRRAVLRPQHHALPAPAHRGREARPHSLHRCGFSPPLTDQLLFVFLQR
jgi:hypothetical protein